MFRTSVLKRRAKYFSYIANPHRKRREKQMKTKKLLPLCLLIVLVSATFATLNSVATNGTNPETDIVGNPKESDEALSQRVHQEYSETTLEYLVNKTTDPSLNNTIIDTNPKRDLDYNEREPQQILPDLNGTANKILFVNESAISFTPPKSTQASTDSATNSSANGGDYIIDSYDPDRPPAEPLPPTKNGHWFPNMDHSRIRYQIETPSYWPLDYAFRLDISAYEDLYARYFRIYWDGSLILDQVIVPAAGYHSDFWIRGAWGGLHRLEFEIWSGYYSDHAWKIDLFKPLGAEPAAHVTGEYFPFTTYGRLRWIVPMGQQTWAEVRIDNVDDPYVRDLKFFVDGVQKQPGRNAPCDLTFDLGSYTQGSTHEIMLEVSWCNYMEWGYIMPKFRVSYGGAAAEIDYLVCDSGAHNHMPHNEVLNYMQVYFVEHGYQRYSLFINESITNTWGNDMTWEIYDDIKEAHFQFDYLTGAKYVLFGHYWYNHSVCGITRYLGAEDIFIADQKNDDYAAEHWYEVNAIQAEKVVLMHECGHSIEIQHYCTNSFCVMNYLGSDNCDDYPYYCQYHWDQRDFPI